MPDMAVSAELAATIGVAGTIVGAVGKWVLDRFDYRLRRHDRVRERTYPDRAKAYVDLIWAVDAVVTRPLAERRSILDQLQRHERGEGPLPDEVRGAFMTRDRVMLISTEAVGVAAAHYCDLVREPGAGDADHRRRTFRDVAVQEIRSG